MLTKTIRGDCYDIIEIRFRQKLHLKLQSIMVCVRMRVRVCKYTYAVHMRKPEMDIGYLPQSLFTLASFFLKFLFHNIYLLLCMNVLPTHTCAHHMLV